MLEPITLLILIVVILAIMLFITMDRVNNLESKLTVEGFTADTAGEAVQNVAKLYNQENFEVTNLKVTGNLEVEGSTNLKGNATTPSATIGNWDIRNDRIGIKDRADMHLAEDKWMRLYDYGGTNYAGTNGSAGGFAGSNLWCAGGTAWSKRNIVDGVTLDKNPAFGGIFRITAPLEVDQAMNTGINWDRPGIMAKNLVIPSKDFAWGQSWWQGPGHQTAVNVASKMPEGSLVIGPAIDHNNAGRTDYRNLVSAAKKIGANNCNIRGMYLSLGNHSGGLACK